MELHIEPTPALAQIQVRSISPDNLADEETHARPPFREPVPFATLMITCPHFRGYIPRFPEGKPSGTPQNGRVKRV
jgi:hypothetical protein